MRRIGFLLAGCGRHDGSEVHETVLLALAVRRRGYRPVYLAPDVEQREVVDHTTGNVDPGAAPRQVMPESARLARGPIRALSDIDSSELDALVIPGGTGVVRHLCRPGEGALGGGPLLPELSRLLDGLAERGAPVGAVGLAQIVLARHADRALANEPVAWAANEVVVEDDGRVLYTPGFMGGDDVSAVAEGIERLVDALGARLTAGSETRR